MVLPWTEEVLKNGKLVFGLLAAMLASLHMADG